MITAVRRFEDINHGQLENKRKRLAQLAKLYGIQRHRLATLIGESIIPEEEKKVKKSLGMPPL